MRDPIRGDVFYCQCDKYRPAVIISNNVFNQKSRYVNVVPISSSIKRVDLPSHVVLSSEITGKRSMVMCENYYTIPKSELKDYICTLSIYTMNKIDKAIEIQLSLNTKKNKY